MYPSKTRQCSVTWNRKKGNYGYYLVKVSSSRTLTSKWDSENFQVASIHWRTLKRGVHFTCRQLSEQFCQRSKICGTQGLTLAAHRLLHNLASRLASMTLRPPSYFSWLVLPFFSMHLLWNPELASRRLGIYPTIVLTTTTLVLFWGCRGVLPD